MAKELKLRRGTTAEHSTFTGAAGEVTVDTDKNTAIVHDGTTAGGYELAKLTDIADATNVAGADGSSGQVLQSDGDGTMSWTTVAAGGANTEIFTSPGTWTNPGNAQTVKVTVVGGGGGGGGATSPINNQTIRGTWGGSGGGAIESIPGPSIPGPVAITVGTGGAGGNNTGGTGGTSSFGAYCSATGGAGGNNPYNSPGSSAGVGGIGSGGDVNMRRYKNFKEGASSIITGDSPPYSPFHDNNAASSSANGASGQPSNGAGGSGAFARGAPARSGGAGVPGVVIVEY